MLQCRVGHRRAGGERYQCDDPTRRLADAVARWIEPLESRLLLSAAASSSSSHKPFCGPLAVYTESLTHKPNKSQKHHEKHEDKKEHHHPKPHHHPKHDGGGGDGGDGDDPGDGEEDGDLIPAALSDTPPDGTGELSDNPDLSSIGANWNFL